MKGVTMSNPNRRQEKMRRRKKRLEKRGRNQPNAPLLASLQSLLSVNKIPFHPGGFPGATDDTVVQADRLKFELMTFATNHSPGQEKTLKLERNLKNGLLNYVHKLDHWAMEEFTYHGLPGDNWHPIDAFLQMKGNAISPAGGDQLRLWKMARIGLYRIIDVGGQTMELQEWDPLRGRTLGDSFRAIALSVGGAYSYCNSIGKLQLTYVAPWAPDENLYCCMGYGSTAPDELVGLCLPQLGLQHPEIVSRPLPWLQNRQEAADYAKRWRAREWQSWFAEHLRFPFWAVVPLPPRGEPAIVKVNGLIPADAEMALHMGIHFDTWCAETSGTIVAGATTVTALDVTTPNCMALAEYQAYRKLVGPPPGMRRAPSYITFDNE